MINIQYMYGGQDKVSRERALMMLVGGFLDFEALVPVLTSEEVRVRTQPHNPIGIAMTGTPEEMRLLVDVTAVFLLVRHAAGIKTLSYPSQVISLMSDAVVARFIAVREHIRCCSFSTTAMLISVGVNDPTTLRNLLDEGGYRVRLAALISLFSQRPISEEISLIPGDAVLNGMTWATPGTTSTRCAKSARRGDSPWSSSARSSASRSSRARSSDKHVLAQCEDLGRIT